MKLLTTSVNSFKRKRTFLLILLFAGTQGNTETECEATEVMSLKCKFPKNMQSNETDFLIYFYPDDGKTELLADCSWNNKTLVCILQDSIEIKRPVSDIAVLSLPSRVVRIPGTYKCIPDGANYENSKACQFPTSQKEEEIQDNSKNGAHLQNPVESLPEKYNDQKGAETSISLIVGAAVGGVAVIILITLLVVCCRKPWMFWKFLKFLKLRKNECFTPKRKSSLSIDIEEQSQPTDNETTDTVSDTQLSNGSQPVPSQQESSAVGHDEDKPLPQSENNENVAIQEDASHEEYPDTVRPKPVPSQQASSAVGHEEDKPLLQSENNENVAKQDASREEYSDTSRSQPVPSQQVSSAVGHEVDKPLLQSENNENVAIREDAFKEEYSSLELKDISCKGFLREKGHKNDRF